MGREGEDCEGCMKQFAEAKKKQGYTSQTPICCRFCVERVVLHKGGNQICYIGKFPVKMEGVCRDFVAKGTFNEDD